MALMTWDELVAEIDTVEVSGRSSAQIAGIEYDSRRVRPGAVFVAMKGGSTDGNRFVEKAIAAGAAGIVTDSAHTFDHLLVYRPEVARAPTSNTAAVRWPRPARPSSAIRSESSPPPALPEPTAKPPRRSSSNRS